jgi:hypothetical protein
MIISWFSQPQESFSSYYQYDTVTTNFTRIRMELGRASSTGATDDTFISFKTQRYVGFSTERYSTSSLDRWSVNADNQLCWDGTPLSSGRPTPGARTYDCTDPRSFVHRGSPVADTPPELPAGITAKHLALLANETFGGSRDATITLTGSDASDEELSTALKNAVCDVLQVDDFATITDEQILAKLTSQVESIRGIAVASKSTSLDQALTEAGKAADLISEQIGAGEIVPNTELTTAFGSLQEAIGKAQGAENFGAVRSALAAIGNARQALTTAIETIDSAQRQAVTDRFSATQEALVEVRQQAIEWEAAGSAYEKLAAATDVADYEKEIFEGTEEVL